MRAPEPHSHLQTVPGGSQGASPSLTKLFSLQAERFDPWPVLPSSWMSFIHLPIISLVTDAKGRTMLPTVTDKSEMVHSLTSKELQWPFNTITDTDMGHLRDVYMACNKVALQLCMWHFWCLHLHILVLMTGKLIVPDIYTSNAAFNMLGHKHFTSTPVGEISWRCCSL